MHEYNDPELRQRTGHLETALSAVTLTVGDKPASRDTLLRLIRRLPDVPMGNLEMIGVDDWAQRRGRVYDPR